MTYYGKYSTNKAEIDCEIDALTKKYSTPGTEELIRQMFTSVIKLHLDGIDEFDLRMLNAAIKELRHSFKIFKKYRGIPKVTIWGSARVKQNSREYKIAHDFAKMMCQHGYMVITGGGGGVMEAGNRGAGDRSFAVNISLPNKQKVNPYITRGEKLIEFKYFFTRKLMFVKESNATVLFPGGFGTNDEAFEMLTLFQTGKSVPRPIVLINPPWSFYWKTWLAFIKKELVYGGFIHKDDLSLFRIVSTAEEAVDEIINYYRVYHSIRSVGPLTVMRLNKELPASAINELNRKFGDILVEGKIEACGPTAEEIKDKDLTELPRLVMKFDRDHHGRLNQMIHRINEF
ncbi:MAG TPA: TIGR00730 family Rossman fold protein [Candidatus Omnitrophota bacterium]|nr:TIGR00730 family Rossman fold protein [Candidatus Omnitrophota bacterium]